MVGEREKEGEWKKGFFFQSFFVSLSCFQPSKPPHTKKIEKNSNTVGKATGRVTLALGDEGLLVLVDEAEPPVAVWTSGPHGLKALFESVKSGATHLAERAAYYSSAAYTESKAKSAEIIEKAKTHGEAAYAKVRQSEEGEGFPFFSSSFRIFFTCVGGKEGIRRRKTHPLSPSVSSSFSKTGRRGHHQGPGRRGRLRRQGQGRRRRRGARGDGEGQGGRGQGRRCDPLRDSFFFLWEFFFP